MTQVQIRRKGRNASETFHRSCDVHKWARQAETRVDQGLSPNKSSAARLATFGDLVDLHIDDFCAVWKSPRRSKAATLATLKNELGNERIDHIDRAILIEYGRKRAKRGADPVTFGLGAGVIKIEEPLLPKFGSGQGTGVTITLSEINAMGRLLSLDNPSTRLSIFTYIKEVQPPSCPARPTVLHRLSVLATSERRLRLCW